MLGNFLIFLTIFLPLYRVMLIKRARPLFKIRAFNRRVDGNYYKYDLVYDCGVDMYKMRFIGRR